MLLLFLKYFLRKCLSVLHLTQKSFDIIEDEAARVKGRRLTLSDINGNGLRWKPFNGTWMNGNYFNSRVLFNSDIKSQFFFLSDGELVYRDPSGGLSILVMAMDTPTVKVLMTNTTFVSRLFFRIFSLSK